MLKKYPENSTNMILLVKRRGHQSWVHSKSKAGMVPPGELWATKGRAGAGGPKDKKKIILSPNSLLLEILSIPQKRLLYHRLSFVT